MIGDQCETQVTEEVSGADHFKDGVRTITLSTWEEFHNAIGPYEKSGGYIWRGQRQAWPLKSSFDRFWDIYGRNRNAVLKRHLDCFRDRMKHCHPQIPLPQDKRIVWSLGQHYGLKSPVLDWTRSPYIAAYFAFEETPVAGDDGFRYVYGLSRSIRRLVIKWKQDGIVKSRQRSADAEDLPPDLVPLFSAQEAAFVMTSRGETIEETVRRWSQKRPQEVVLVKMQIPEKERERWLDELDRMQVNYKELLLVLTDVVSQCNCALKKYRVSAYVSEKKAWGQT